MIYQTTYKRPIKDWSNPKDPSKIDPKKTSPIICWKRKKRWTIYKWTISAIILWNITWDKVVSPWWSVYNDLAPQNHFEAVNHLWIHQSEWTIYTGRSMANHSHATQGLQGFRTVQRRFSPRKRWQGGALGCLGGGCRGIPWEHPKGDRLTEVL